MSLLLAATTSVASSAGQCPKGCKCSHADECKKLVECRKVDAFPTEYPKGTDCVLLQNKKLGALSLEEKATGLAALPPTLKQLDLSESRLHEIKAGWFQHLNEVRVLNLEFNNLKAIPGNAFQGLPKLKVLWLTGNHYSPDEKGYMQMKEAANALVDIDKDAFAGLSNLQVLLMHHNQIATLDESVFNGLGKLKVLKLVDNPVAGALKKTDHLFDPIRENCYQLDLKQDSGDDLEDYWEQNQKYFSDEWLPGKPPAYNKKEL